MPVNEECTITCAACGHDGSLDEWTIKDGRYTCRRCVRSFRRLVGPGKRFELLEGTAFYLPGKVTIEVEAPNERD